MKMPAPFVILSVFLVSAGCASTGAESKKIYTAQEKNMLTYCVGMSDTAMYVATKKLGGARKDEVKQYYSSKPNAQLNTATVEKVYGDGFSSAWDYTVSFFTECAQNIASVPRDRVKLAAYCMQNQLIADVAHSFKSAGAPKEKAYAYFAPFKSDTPKSIVDQVYASSASRAEIKLEVWNGCMSVISGK